MEEQSVLIQVSVGGGGGVGVGPFTVEEQRVLIQVSVEGWGGGGSLHSGGTEGSHAGQGLGCI